MGVSKKTTSTALCGQVEPSLVSALLSLRKNPYKEFNTRKVNLELPVSDGTAGL